MLTLVESRKGVGGKPKEELKMKVNVIIPLSMCCCDATDHVFTDGNVRRRRRSNRRHCTGRRDDVPAVTLAVQTEAEFVRFVPADSYEPEEWPSS